MKQKAVARDAGGRGTAPKQTEPRVTRKQIVTILKVMVALMMTDPRNVADRPPRTGRRSKDSRMLRLTLYILTIYYTSKVNGNFND